MYYNRIMFFKKEEQRLTERNTSPQLCLIIRIYPSRPPGLWRKRKLYIKIKSARFLEGLRIAGKMPPKKIVQFIC